MGDVMKKWLFGGLALFAIGAIALAQTPSLFLSVANLTGNEQFNVIEPSTGTVVTSPQILAVTLKNVASWAGQFVNGINAQTGTSYTFTGAGASPDAGKLTTFSNTSSVAVTLPQAGSAGFPAGTVLIVQNINSGVVTITPTTSTINGSSSVTLNQNRGIVIVSDGTNYQIETNGSGLAITAAKVSEGGSGAATFTAHGVLTGEGTNAFAATAVGTTGQLLQGVSSADPTWATTLSGNLTLSGANTYSGVSTFSGQMLSTTGLPTIASGACGTSTNGAVVAGSTNQSGNITIGATATTTCTVSFSATLGTAPNACMITPANAAAAATGTTVARVSSITTSQFVITGSALANANYAYLCL